MPRQHNIKDENKILPMRLRAVMKHANKTPDQVAKGIGITRQSVNNYMLGVRVPDAETLGKIAKHLNVSTDYLLGVSDTKSLNEDIQAAAKTTGLTGDAIEVLARLKKYNINKPLQMLELLLYDAEYRTELFIAGGLEEHVRVSMVGSLLAQMYDYVSVMADEHLKIEFQKDGKPISGVLAFVAGDSVPEDVCVSEDDISDAYIYTKERRMISSIGMLCSRLYELRELEEVGNGNAENAEK